MRAPDLTIGSPPQTQRWHLFHRWGLQVSLHKWLRSDTDRALHDHSADNISILLNRGYWEVFSHAWEEPRVKRRRPFWPYFRKAETPHRVLLDQEGQHVWTIWIRFKPRREWGFWCPKGWRHWKQYVAEREGYYKSGVSTVGRGCE